MSRPGRPLFADLSVTRRLRRPPGRRRPQRHGQVDAAARARRRREPEAGVVRRGRGRAHRRARPAARAAAGRRARRASARAGRPRPCSTASGMGGLARRTHQRALGRPGQAGRAGADAGRPSATCSCSTSRPTTSTSTPSRGSRTGSPRTAAGWSSSPTTATCSTASPRASSSSTAARATSTTAATPCYLEGKAEREEQAARPTRRARNLARRELAWLRRGAPARTRKPKAAHRARPPRSSRARAEAAAPRPATSTCCTSGTPRLGDQVVELHGVGHRYRRRAARCSRGRRPAARPARAPRHRRAQRHRQVDAARHHRRADRSPPRAASCTAPRCALGYYDQVGVDARPERSGCATPSPARPASADWQRRRAARAVLVRRRRAVGADRPALGRRAPAPAAAARAGRTAQRAAARRAHQRPRPRHAPRARGLPRRLARARWWWSATTGRSSSAPSTTWWCSTATAARPPARRLRGVGGRAARPGAPAARSVPRPRPRPSRSSSAAPADRAAARPASADGPSLGTLRLGCADRKGLAPLDRRRGEAREAELAEVSIIVAGPLGEQLADRGAGSARWRSNGWSCPQLEAALETR